MNGDCSSSYVRGNAIHDSYARMVTIHAVSFLRVQWNVGHRAMGHNIFLEDGIERVRELDKQILSKGAWVTIMFSYQEWVPAKNEYGPKKYTIRRYQKRNDQYWQKSKFNISSDEQAKKIIETLSTWVTAS